MYPASHGSARTASAARPKEAVYLGVFPEVIAVLFGCRHQFAFPIRMPDGDQAYQVCVRCGVEYEYDWGSMRRLGARNRKQKPATRSDSPCVRDWKESSDHGG